MHIQIVTFELKGPTPRQYEESCNQIAGFFASAPGLLSKQWLSNPETNTFGGVYTWTDAAAMRDFLAREDVQRIYHNPAFANVSIREFGVLEGPTRVTNGVPATVEPTPTGDRASGDTEERAEPERIAA